MELCGCFKKKAIFKVSTIFVFSKGQLLLGKNYQKQSLEQLNNIPIKVSVINAIDNLIQPGRKWNLLNWNQFTVLRFFPTFPHRYLPPLSQQPVFSHVLIALRAALQGCTSNSIAGRTRDACSPRSHPWATSPPSVTGQSHFCTPRPPAEHRQCTAAELGFSC